MEGVSHMLAELDLVKVGLVLQVGESRVSGTSSGQAPPYAFLRGPSWLKNLDSRLRGNDRKKTGVHRHSSFGSVQSLP